MEKSCSTCDHFPNDKHCIGCLWSDKIQGNTKWEKKCDPDVIDRKVIEDIKAEISKLSHWQSSDGQDLVMLADVLECIEKHMSGKKNNGNTDIDKR